MRYFYRWLGEDGAMSIQEGGRRRCPAGKWRWWRNTKRRGKSQRRTHSWTWYLIFSLSLSTFLDTDWLFVHFHFFTFILHCLIPAYLFSSTIFYPGSRILHRVDLAWSEICRRERKTPSWKNHLGGKSTFFIAIDLKWSHPFKRFFAFFHQLLLHCETFAWHIFEVKMSTNLKWSSKFPGCHHIMPLLRGENKSFILCFLKMEFNFSVVLGGVDGTSVEQVQHSQDNHNSE